VGIAELTRNAVTVLPEGALEEKLKLGRPLRVKLGIDVTAPDVTLGNGIPLQRMRAFQEEGHLGVLIVGDYTTRIGDPSGRKAARPMIDPAEIDRNAQRFFDHASTIIDPQRTELRFNSEWLATLDFAEILRLTRTTTVARMLERDDFAKRYAANQPISLMEFMYPLLQGYDSVAVEADVELGGTDQLFNLLVGRDLQRDAGQDPQVALTMPLLEGLDGVQKMSQSLGNYVGIAEPPDEQFGKLMSIPDGLIVRYLRLATGLPPAEVDAVEAGLADGSRRPLEEKRRLALEVVDLYHGPGSGAAAQERFDRVHRARELPEEIENAPIPDEVVSAGTVWLPKLLVGLGRAGSNGEARRLIEQGGVRLDGEVVTDAGAELPLEALRGRVLQVGRRWFGRLS
jgi:tyrosyl-tRNA synthetase